MALLRKETSTMVHGAEWQRPIGCLIFIGHLPAPVNHVKIFKGWPLRDAPSELVQLWYKTFLPDRFLSGEMKKPTMLSNKTSTA